MITQRRFTNIRPYGCASRHNCPLFHSVFCCCCGAAVVSALRAHTERPKPLPARGLRGVQPLNPRDELSRERSQAVRVSHTQPANESKGAKGQRAIARLLPSATNSQMSRPPARTHAQSRAVFLVANQAAKMVPSIIIIIMILGLHYTKAAFQTHTHTHTDADAQTRTAAHTLACAPERNQFLAPDSFQALAAARICA